MTPSKASIHSKDNKLTVSGELGWQIAAEFDEACQKLAQYEDPELIIDLSEINIITSPFFGILYQTAVQCLRNNKKVTMLVPAKFLSLFHSLNFEKFAKIEVV